MARENSISDEADGRSLTPDLPEEELNPRLPRSPTYSNPQARNPSKVSSRLRSPTGSHAPPQRSPTVSPTDRFRATVRKVMQMHRTTTLLSARGAGAEPGVDPRRDSANLAYGHIRENCVIDICDYSSVRSSSGRMGNREFVQFLNDDDASAKEPWVKVRWINVSGISWDVISALAIKYDLHPLALEDILHTTAQKRSKVDYYTRHLFIRVLCHSVAKDGEFTLLSAPVYETHPSAITDLPRSTSPDLFNDRDVKDLAEFPPEDNGEDTHPSTTITPRKGLRARFLGDVEKGPSRRVRTLQRLGLVPNSTRAERIQEEITLEELKKGDRVNVKVEPVFIFLTRKGTVISLHPLKNHGFTDPIMSRLRQRHTLLRTSADPSLLVQSLLDLVVDQALEVMDEYHGKILKFERNILLRPKMKTVRNLHIMSGDLILHKRTLDPIKTMIYGLRRYDLDRCAALIDQSIVSENVKVEGYMSHKAKIYLADVYDHMEHILVSLDMFSGIAENLIAYSFNVSSAEMNNVMRRLTIVTIVAIPLTLLTGYFGMNFERMWSVHYNSDAFFWALAIPILLVIIPLAMSDDIIKLIHYLQKRYAAQNAVKTFKQA